MPRKTLIPWPDKVTMRMLVVLMLGGRFELRDDNLWLAHAKYNWPLADNDVALPVLERRGWIVYQEGQPTATITREGQKFARIYLKTVERLSLREIMTLEVVPVPGAKEATHAAVSG